MRLDRENNPRATPSPVTSHVTKFRAAIGHTITIITNSGSTQASGPDLKEKALLQTVTKNSLSVLHNNGPFSCLFVACERNWSAPDALEQRG